MKCEKCGKEHDGSYGSGRFCSPVCAKSFSASSGTKKEILEENKRKIIKRDYDTKDEKWKLIAKTDNFYAISTMGRVMSMRNGKIMKTIISNRGYELVIAKYNGKQKSFSVNRLVAEAFIPNPNNFPIVNHIDVNPLNNKVDNLEWCTYSYNNVFKDAHLKRGSKLKGIPSKLKGKPVKYKKIKITSNSGECFVFDSVRSASQYISDITKRGFDNVYGGIYKALKSKSKKYLSYQFAVID